MCISPLTLTTGIVPCSKCPECKARRISAWSLRLTQQIKESKSAHFITLTYEKGHDKYGDYPRRSPNGFATLLKGDVQRFLKRLRKHASQPVGLHIKYYAAGEYGSKTARPHYHLIIYNATPDAISSTWTHGNVHFGKVESASIGYCLKYISKGRTVPKHRRDDRQPEFSLMSKGLGAAYLTPAMINWHKADPVNRVYATIEDGKKISLPRYYKDRVFSDKDKNDIAEHFKQFHIDQKEFAEHSDWQHAKQQTQENIKAAKSNAKLVSTQNEIL